LSDFELQTAFRETWKSKGPVAQSEILDPPARYAKRALVFGVAVTFSRTQFLGSLNRAHPSGYRLANQVPLGDFGLLFLRLLG
jgi:hypothetical protein